MRRESLASGIPSSYKDYVNDEKHLEQIVAVLDKGEATVATLASRTRLAQAEVSRLLAKLQDDNRVIKFADRDEWFLLLDFT